MLITTLRPPAPSPLPLKPSTCAFTPKSAGGTAPCAWSCSAASCQVSELDMVRLFAQNINNETSAGNCVIFLYCSKTTLNKIISNDVNVKSFIRLFMLSSLLMCVFIGFFGFFVIPRLLWANGNEIRPYPGLPDHSFKYLPDCQHGHVHLGAWKGPAGQTRQGQCLDGRTQWPVAVAAGMICSALTVASVAVKMGFGGKFWASSHCAQGWGLTHLVW